MKNNASIPAALAVMETHIRALNAHDEAKLATTLHFPHFRLSGTELKTWKTAGSYFADFRARAGGNWAYSRFDDIQVVQSSATKVHLNAQVNRFDTDDHNIASFRSLWIITFERHIWAAKFRSTFAAV